MKRSVSLNHMAPSDWLPGAGNRNLKAKARQTDLNAFWRRKLEELIVFFMFFMNMNKFSQKSSCHIPFESANHIHQ